MATQQTLPHAYIDDTLPKVRTISISDLKDALASGIDDFLAMPSHAVFLCLLYPVVGLILCRLAFGYDILPLLFPVISGFALVGPVAAIGLYELSRRREQGLDSSAWHAFDVLRSPSIGSIVALSILLLAIFLTWLGAAQALYIRIFGDALPLVSFSQFVHQVFATPEGTVLILAGNAIGFLFAVFVLAISVVSMPMLLDRNVSAATAIVTSVRAVLANPIPMALWGLIVAVSLALGSLPLFFGLAVVMPVLGHATWHLYRKVVQR